MHFAVQEFKDLGAAFIGAVYELCWPDQQGELGST